MFQRQVGAILLVSGTAIGAAMIALPVTVAPVGFLGAVLLLFVYWLLMSWTGLLFCELSLAMPPKTHLVTMACQTLGKKVRYLIWGMYVCLLYSLCSAYLSGLNDMLIHLMHWPKLLGLCSIILTFFLIFRASICVIDVCNRLLLLLFAFVFVWLCCHLAPAFQLPKMLIHAQGFQASLSIVATSFGFHIIIPTLRDFLGKDAKTCLPRVIVLGAFLPLAIYLLWITLLVGGFMDAMQAGSNGSALTVWIADMLANRMPSIWMSTGMQILMFSVVATSFIGVTLSLFDFLKDACQNTIQCSGYWVWLTTFLPPVFFVLLAPKGFIIALHYAGVFVAGLLVILPIVMVQHLRTQQLSGEYQAPWSMGLKYIGLGMGLLTIVVELYGRWFSNA